MAIDRQKAVDRARRLNKYNARYVKDNYYRVSITFPKDYKELFQNAGIESINGYVKELVHDDLTRRGVLGASGGDSCEVPFE